MRRTVLAGVAALGLGACDPPSDPGRPLRDGSALRSRAPKPTSIVVPVFPDRARDLGVEAFVVLGLEVDRVGRVRHVWLHEPAELSDPDHPELAPEFEEAAIEAVRSWRFLPATERGRAIEFVLAIPLEFELNRRAGVPQ